MFTTGGMAVVNSLIKNKVVVMLCLADNKIGAEVSTLLGGRLAGNLKNLAASVRSGE